MVDFTEAVRVESARFADAIGGADLTLPVPCCPGWVAADLLWHLAEVQDFWGRVVAGGISDPEQVERIRRPADEALFDHFLESSKQLVRVLGEHDPAEPCWTWSSDHTVGFVQRRQAHEALVHRVDAEITAGRAITPINSDLAGDGIDEILRVMVGRPPEWGEFTPDGTVVRIEALDAGVAGTTWGVAFGRFSGASPTTGVDYDLEAASIGPDATDPDAVIRGAAAAVDLWLWGRGPLGALAVEGDRLQADRLRQLAAETTR